MATFLLPNVVYVFWTSLEHDMLDINRSKQ